MSEPIAYPPPPFSPEPLAPSERSGCRKVALLGCGGLFVLFALGCLALVLKATEVLRWGLRIAEQDIVSKLEPNVPAEVRERLHRAFEAARNNVGKVTDTAVFQEFQSRMLELSSKPRLTAEDAANLATALEKLGGVAVPAPGIEAPPPVGTSPPADAPQPAPTT